MTEFILLLMIYSAARENSVRAVIVSILVSVPVTAAIWLIFLFPANPIVHAFAAGYAILMTSFIVLSLATWKHENLDLNMSRAAQVDERTHMFSRANLIDHSNLSQRYYEAHPEHREADEALWKNISRAAESRKYYDRHIGSIADAAFNLLDRSYKPLSDRPRQEKPDPPDPLKLMAAIHIAATMYGAVDVGVTRLQSYHLYSHAGRHAENWGQPVKTDHATAIVLVVPMDPAMIHHAPSLPTILQSSRQYVESAKIAHIIAEMITMAGGQATAHVDGHYQVICPPLAQDAGLGHVGRIGIFIHPIYGPCVRLSVVTTNLILPHTTGRHEYIEDFCRICMKCADNCPTQAISKREKNHSRGFPHWSINQESCYGFWQRIGTDCAVCVRSCPFSKPDTLLHKVVRAYIRHNAVNRKLALWGEDLFYGRKLHLPSGNPGWSRLHRILKGSWRRS